MFVEEPISWFRSQGEVAGERLKPSTQRKGCESAKTATLAPLASRHTLCSSPTSRPPERILFVRRRHLDFRHGTHCPGGGYQSSTLLPSGSMTQPNFPYSESSVFSRTLHPSSRSA